MRSYSEFMSIVLVILNAKRMRHIVIRGLSGCVIFFTLSYKRRDYRKKKLRNRKCVFRFCVRNLTVPVLILRSTERDMIWSPCTVPDIIVRFQLNLKFLDRFSKNAQISNFMIMRIVGSVMRTAGPTNRRNATNSHFSKFCVLP